MITEEETNILKFKTQKIEGIEMSTIDLQQVNKRFSKTNQILKKRTIFEDIDKEDKRKLLERIKTKFFHFKPFEVRDIKDLIKQKDCINVNQNKLTLNKLYLCCCQNDRTFLICKPCRKKCHSGHKNFIKVECYSKCMCEQKINHNITIDRFTDISSHFKNKCFFEPFFEYFPNKGFVKIIYNNNDKNPEHYCSVCAENCKNISINQINNTLDYKIIKINYSRQIHCECKNHTPPTLITFYNEVLGKREQEIFEGEDEDSENKPEDDSLFQDHPHQTVDKIIDENDDINLEQAEGDSGFDPMIPENQNNLSTNQIKEEISTFKEIDFSKYFYNFCINFASKSTVNDINDYCKILIDPMIKSIEDFNDDVKNIEKLNEKKDTNLSITVNDRNDLEDQEKINEIYEKTRNNIFDFFTNF